MLSHRDMYKHSTELDYNCQLLMSYSNYKWNNYLHLRYYVIVSLKLFHKNISSNNAEI